MTILNAARGVVDPTMLVSPLTGDSTVPFDEASFALEAASAVDRPGWPDPQLTPASTVALGLRGREVTRCVRG